MADTRSLSSGARSRDTVLCPPCEILHYQPPLTPHVPVEIVTAALHPHAIARFPMIR